MTFFGTAQLVPVLESTSRSYLPLCHIFEALGCHKFEFMRTVNEYGSGIVNAQAPHTARNTPGVGVWFTLLPRVSLPHQN